LFFFFSSRRRHTRSTRDWSSDVCSSDLDLVRDPRLRARGGVPVDDAVGGRAVEDRLGPGEELLRLFDVPGRDDGPDLLDLRLERSEERRVGKECRGGWVPENQRRVRYTC